MTKQIQEDLPANYLTIIASVITLANIREQECPGVFQYIADEMYRANGLPVIKYPATVIAGFENHITKKRGRETSEEEQVMEAEEGAVGGTIDESRCTQSLLDLLALIRELPASTPAPTPTPTPTSTPAQSPVRVLKEERATKNVPEPSKKKGKKEDDPRVSLITYVTQPLFESRMNWIHDPAPPTPHCTAMDYSDTPVQSSDTPVQSRDTRVKSCDTHTKSRDPPVLTSDTQASAIAINASSGAPLALPHPKKSRRRRRRRNRRSANENSAPRSAASVTPDERWANRNSASKRATQHQPAASDPTQMKSTPVYKGQSIHSSQLTQPPIPATNRNSAFPFGLDCCEFPGLYKPAFPDLRSHLISYPEERRFSQKLFSAVELLCILLCANFGIQAFIFHHTSLVSLGSYM